MTLYYIDTDVGCGVRSAANIAQATKNARDEVGQLVRSVRRATDDDVKWVAMMGGHVPEEAQ